MFEGVWGLEVGFETTGAEFEFEFEFEFEG